MKTILLCDNTEVFVDDCDYNYLCSFGSWKPMKSGSHHTVYATRNCKRNGKTFTLRMHRLIMECISGPISNQYVVDHIDGNGRNNVRNNLRILTHTENKRRHKLNKGNTSGYTGVSFDKSRKMFAAYVTENRKKTHLGYFFYAREAAKAYNKVALERFGILATLNVIED